MKERQTRLLRFAGLSAVLLTAVFVGLKTFPRAAGVSRLESLQDRAQLIATSGVHLLCLQDRSHNALLRYSELREQQDLDRVLGDLAEMERVSTALRHQLDTGKERQLLSRYETAREQLMRVDGKILEAVRGGDPDKVAVLIDRASQQKKVAAASVHELLSESNRRRQAVIHEVRAHEDRTRWALIGRALTLVFVLWLLLQIRWSILRPLRQLTDAAERIATGDLTNRPELSATRGQLGELTRAFENMRRRLIETHQMLELRIAQRTCELKRNQERLELAIDASEAGLWDWEPKRKHVTYNGSWARILGYSHEELDSEEEALFARVHPDDRSAVRARFHEHLSGECPHYESEHRLRSKSGDWFWVAERGRVVERDEHGAPVRVIGLMRDITRRREAEEELHASRRELQNRSEALASTNEELERSNEEMAQFVYTVSHDLKSPLITMKGFVGVLKEDLGGQDTQAVADSVRRIEKAATHMSRLIEGLLRLSRAGRAHGELTVVDVPALLHDITASLRSHLDELGIELEIQDAMPQVRADREALGRVFENLLNNAVKYGCKGQDPRITVGSETADGEVRFFVRDNGPGIPLECHDKVFKLFQRLESEGDGTGIGLAIVAKIMHAHHGRVWVESAPGEGATFWLAFEADREAAPA